ncbi:MAG: SH3 domain-containing protein [FCB group bacterium]|jgi:hypothetical protein|nr:SH3 domain-containing protein [FCB group bacterium]
MNMPLSKGFRKCVDRLSFPIVMTLVLVVGLASCGDKEPAVPDSAPSALPAPTTVPVTPPVPGATQTPASPLPVPAEPTPSAAAPSVPAAPAAITATGQTANLGKLLPVDEAKRAPGLTDFRKKLEDAVKKKDKNAVVALLSPNVRTGNQQGVDAFVKTWNLDDANSRFWTDIGTALRQGGSFGLQGGNNVFTVPHVYGRLPQGIDPAQYGVISGERVNVRKTPDRQGETLTRLTYDIVKLAPNPDPKQETIDGETHPWVAVILSDGQTGYVYGRYIRQANGLHAAFERVGDEWKLTYFGEGQ